MQFSTIVIATLATMGQVMANECTLNYDAAPLWTIKLDDTKVDEGVCQGIWDNFKSYAPCAGQSDWGCGRDPGYVVTHVRTPIGCSTAQVSEAIKNASGLDVNCFIV